MFTEYYMSYSWEKKTKQQAINYKSLEARRRYGYKNMLIQHNSKLDSRPVNMEILVL